MTTLTRFASISGRSETPTPSELRDSKFDVDADMLIQSLRALGGPKASEAGAIEASREREHGYKVSSR